jgi:type IX secretion system substrate protein
MKSLLIVLGMIMLGNNSFAQWVEQSTGVSNDLNSISSSDNNTCWASGDNGTVIRTTDGGLNWQNVGGGSLGTNTLYNIFAIDGNIAIVSTTTGSNALVFRTTNGGVSWLQMFSQQNGFINSIWMTSSSNGFMMGDPVGGRWSLWKTTNGGANWDSTGLRLNQIGSEYGWVNGMFALDSQIWFNTFSARLYYSSNNGTNWSIQTTAESFGFGTVWFNSPMNGMSSGGDIAYSSNSGNTWILRNLQNNFITGIMGNGNYFWECEFNLPSRLQMTSNGGLNWFIEYEPAAGQLSHMTASRTGNTGWACMTNGKIAKRMIPLSVTIQSSDVPNQFSLLQNHPNPFNPTTKIKFALPNSSFAKLVVYDMLGKEITTLVNEQLKPGTYEVDFDGTNYPSGVYYYKLQTAEYTETKKMILVK